MSSDVEVYVFDKIATTDFCDTVTEGNPIHPATGANFEQQTLLSVQGVLPIQFTLQYHSLRLSSGLTGRGWEDQRFGAKLAELSNATSAFTGLTTIIMNITRTLTATMCRHNPIVYLISWSKMPRAALP